MDICKKLKLLKNVIEYDYITEIFCPNCKKIQEETNNNIIITLTIPLIQNIFNLQQIINDNISKMAENGLLPEAVPPDINYRCHPNKVNSMVICILCNNVYHKSDFFRILEKKNKYCKMRNQCISTV